ncbi:MAG TPA: hypothetical protein VM680_13380 [Verrucomicrobiae bacterium]|nr:hypothetical protein [Verrucomicrobiae bacterium]
MNLKTKITVTTLAIAASTMLVWSQPSENNPPTIQGVWQVSRVGVNCNDPSQALGTPFPALMSFHRDGLVEGAAKSPVTGPFDTPQYGTWRREPGSQNYSFRALSYRYDNSGVFAGSLLLTANVELTDANSFTYSATIQIANANGNPIANNCGRGIGTRFE